MEDYASAERFSGQMVDED